MFDLGFWELAIIGVVALLVIGPNRLPEVARTAGLYVGKVRRFVASVQRDIDTEISKAEELNKLLEEQKKIVERHEIIEAKRYWRRNHKIIRARAHTARRNPRGWGAQAK